MTAFSMEKQLAIGEILANEQDAIFRRWFDVREASMHDDRFRGIDRFVSPNCKSAGVIVPFEIPVQYKGDTWIHDTGNCSVEYLSRDKQVAIGGWLSTHAMWISVYSPTAKCCHILDAAALRIRFGVWWATSRRGDKYSRKPCAQTSGGRTWNILVPLKDMEGVHIGTLRADDQRLTLFDT